MQAQPTLIIVHSHIGYGAPHKQDTKEAHGEPLGSAYSCTAIADILQPLGGY